MKVVYGNIISRLTTDWHAFIFYAIITFAFLVRFINIDYNSPFNDEAIYIVIGKMGLFANDWWSYGANFWMAGLPYIYPSLTSLVYEIGGLTFSRFLNVVFGVILIEEVYRFVRLINLFDEKTNKAAALIAAFLVGFSGIGIFVSRLATYDMPSFLLLMLGINFFLESEFSKNGKYYFTSFLCLTFAFLTKIVVGVFLPVLFIISILVVRRRGKDHIKNSVIYLYVPFAITFFLYIAFNFNNLLTYFNTQADQGRVSNSILIIGEIASHIWIIGLFLIPAIIFLLKKGKKNFVAALVSLSIAIPALHLPFLRFSTLDKHMYLTVIFLSVILSCAAGYIVTHEKKRTLKLLVPFAAFFVLFYLMNSYDTLRFEETAWKNTNSLASFLESRVSPGDKVLTEEGASTVLVLYDKIFPPGNIVTFDWINYQGKQGEDAYIDAIRDGYFKYIQLTIGQTKNKNLQGKIRSNLDNYNLVYNKNEIHVYEKE